MAQPIEISLEKMNEWIESNRSRMLKDYQTFLSFSSISADPAFKDSVLECADWLVDYLQSMGFHVQQWPTTGHPVIFASWNHPDPNKPTLLIYNHYDVQPVDPLEEWTTPPFEPTLREGQIYARGAQDNKGQCFYVLQALKLLIEKTGSLPLNIKLCIEGEEEMGSAGLSRLLPSKASALKADYLAIVDVGLQNADAPSLTLGIRGLVTMDVEVEAGKTDLHSGLHGGIAQNPIHALVELLASLRDENGKISIPGFYDQVAAISPAENTAISFDFDPLSYHQESGGNPYGGENAYTPLERNWMRPTLEINGIRGGYTGQGFKTVIPAKAHAKVSCRLVPHQHPKEIGKLVSDYLQTHAPKGVKVQVHVHKGQGNPVRVSPNARVVQCFAQAFSHVFGSPCQFILDGASIPVAAELAKTSGAEMILVGLGLATDQIHAPNEHFGMDRIEKGTLILARAVELLATK